MLPTLTLSLTFLIKSCKICALYTWLTKFSPFWDWIFLLFKLSLFQALMYAGYLFETFCSFLLGSVIPKAIVTSDQTKDSKRSQGGSTNVPPSPDSNSKSGKSSTTTTQSTRRRSIKISTMSHDSAKSKIMDSLESSSMSTSAGYKVR